MWCNAGTVCGSIRCSCRARGEARGHHSHAVLLAATTGSCLSHRFRHRRRQARRRVALNQFRQGYGWISKAAFFYGRAATDEDFDVVILVPDVRVHPGYDSPVLEPEG
jgi:hypothetical protein